VTAAALALSDPAHFARRADVPDGAKSAIPGKIEYVKESQQILF